MKIACPTCRQVMELPDAEDGRPIRDDPAMRIILPVGRSVWAIAAGYLGLFAVPLLPAPIALIISIVAIRDLKRHPDKHGLGRAISGLASLHCALFAGLRKKSRSTSALAGVKKNIASHQGPGS